MYKFQLKPSVFEFKKLFEFVEHFGISAEDTVFTEKFLYEKYMKGILECNYIFQDDYGLGEPTDIIIDKILKDTYGREVKRIVGIGGGSILDIAKLMCIKNATTVEEIFDDKIPLIRDKELILVPTTCGTGCEVTCVSVVDMTAKKTKVGKRIEANFADSAVLIEELLDSIPAKIFVYSSMDALIHAMEIFVAPTGNPYNDIFCRSAIKTIILHFKNIIENGIEKRFEYSMEFLRASTLAGIALSNTPCGAVHALAMHFGSAHHVPHGEANSRFLTAVFKKYSDLSPSGKLQEIADIINEVLVTDTNIKGSLNALEDLIEKLLPKKRLHEYGVQEKDIENYVDKVIETQQRLLKNNFVYLSREDLLEIYRSLF